MMLEEDPEGDEGWTRIEAQVEGLGLDGWFERGRQATQTAEGRFRKPLSTRCEFPIQCSLEAHSYLIQLMKATRYLVLSLSR